MALAGVVFRDIQALPGGRDVRGFGLTTFVLVHSHFWEVLYLDADVVVVHDPTPLFASREYTATGAVFWPAQIPHFETSAIVWEILYSRPERFLIDNAVMLVHRSRHLEELELAHFFNQRWRPLQSSYPFFLNGDADMFVFAWLAMRRPYHMVLPPADLIGWSSHARPFCGHSVFVRHPNRSDELLISHRARNKFSYWPKVDMPSNAIKRSSPSLVQGLWEPGFSKFTCLDFFYHEADIHVGSDVRAASYVEGTMAAQTALYRLAALELELLSLREHLTMVENGSRVRTLRPKWVHPFSRYCAGLNPAAS